jgi:hypothetical protein
MSLSFLLEVSCDGDQCEETLRTWNWASIGALAAANGELRRADWLTIKTPGQHVKHYCPAHKAMPEEAWDAVRRRADRSQAWVKRKPVPARR